MADQYTRQDPTRQYPAPDRERQPEIQHPGLTANMVTAPDHGEKTYRGSGRLEGRRALITGADSGIGRAVALAFAREGADVVVSCLGAEESDARETVRLVEEAGRRGVVATGDITSEDHCQTLVDLTVRELGGIDILVNNAAFQMVQAGGIADITTEQFDRVLRTNLYALFWLCKKSVAVMEPGSTIVNTSSIQGMNPSPGLLDYATTKAGIIDFTKGLAADVAKRGIRVNAVAPGPIWTPLIPATMPADGYRQIRGRCASGEARPAGRTGARVRIPRIERIQLCHRRSARRHRRDTLHLTTAEANTPSQSSNTPSTCRDSRHGLGSAVEGKLCKRAVSR